MAKSIFSGIKKTVIRGKNSSEKKPTLSGDHVILFDQTLADQLITKSIGELKHGALYINIYEACMLVEDKKMDVFDKEGKKLSLKALMDVGNAINEGFSMKYDVYSDLRLSRGYITKPGIKFGCDFVVYGRGKKPGKSHSKWMVHIMPESARIDYAEFTRAARLATNVKKKMLFATVTERGPVYYELSRAKM